MPGRDHKTEARRKICPDIVHVASTQPLIAAQGIDSGTPTTCFRWPTVAVPWVPSIAVPFINFDTNGYCFWQWDQGGTPAAPEWHVIVFYVPGFFIANRYWCQLLHNDQITGDVWQTTYLAQHERTVIDEYDAVDTDTGAPAACADPYRIFVA